MIVLTRPQLEGYMLHAEETYRRPESMVADIPTFTEYEEIGQRNASCLGLGSEDAEDRRVDMIFRDASNENKFLHTVLIGHIANRQQNLSLDTLKMVERKPHTFHAMRRRQTEYVPGSMSEIDLPP